MINIDYVSLHNHTSYSLMRGLISPERLIELAKEAGQTAVAVTDHATFAGLWDSLKAAKKHNIKLIAGCEFNFVDKFDEIEKVKTIILLAKNQEGYKNLLTLGFRAYDNSRTLSKKVVPIIDWELLEKYKDGLICLTGDGNGLISQEIMNKDFTKALSDIKRLYSLFGHDDFALELQPHALKRRESAYSGTVDQVFINRKLKQLSIEVGCRCVVTTNTYYEKKEHKEDQDVLIAIGSGQPIYSQNRLTFNVPDFYVKNSIEVASFFTRHHKFWGEEFINSLFDNSIFFANRCEHAEWIDPKFSNPSGKELPNFPVQDEPCYQEFSEWKSSHYPDLDDDVAYMRYKCDIALKKRIPAEKHKEYIDRLNEEYEVLEYHGFSSYMLIVSDYIDWAKKHKIKVGPGRGCLTGDALVLTEQGYKRLDSIKVGDKVYTHKGRLRNVTNTFKYDIDEEGLEIVSEHSYKTIKLTKDHKIYAMKNGQLDWIKAKDLEQGDKAFMPYISNIENNTSDCSLHFTFYTEENALKCKEILLKHKIASEIFSEINYFSKVNYIETFYVNTSFFNPNKNTEGYFCKIKEIRNIKLKQVYDISVDEDTSYLTTNYAVHNSCGGSLVAYLLDIHVLDPIKYNLIFARFHNKEKTSFPDIDTDFVSSGREKVQTYIRNKYGEEYVAHVSNKNTITPKVYARDVTRVFELGDKGRKEAVQIGNDIADSIPSDIKSTEGILEKASLFAEYVKVYPKLGQFLNTVGGSFRAWSTHAGGIVIGKRPLVGLVPLRKDEHGQVSLEYDKDTAEENGLVKLDTLAISTLDVIESTYNLIKENKKQLPPENIDFEQHDQATYDLISSGKTFGAFQLGGTAAPLCRDLKPNNVLDISHINALMRPSCATIRSDFIKTRHGEKQVSLLHPILERSFGDTYGFGLYEECLMYLAQDVAGWDLHSADRLRKMTKGKGKYAKQAEKWREEFIEGAVNVKKLDKELAIKIWDEVVQKFSGYGFNSSHSLFYSVLGFETSYLKAHYPLEFLLANLMKDINSNSPKAKDNILKIKDEIRQSGIRIVTPDVNQSEQEYKIVNDKILMAGLNSMKFMGTDAIPEIISKRPYESLQDFLTKVDGRKVNSRAIQAMAASGCFDSIANGLTRKQMFYYAADFKKKLQAHLKKKPETRGEFNYPWPEEKEWSTKDLFALETYYLGEGVSGSIKDRYPLFFNQNVINFSKLTKVFKFSKKDEDEKKNRKLNTFYLSKHGISGLKGIITSIFAFKVKKEDSPILGQKMARLEVQDIYGNDLSIIAFPDSWENIQNRISDMSGGKHTLEPGVAIYFTGAFQYENEHATSFIIDDILDYQEIPELPEDLKARKIKLPRKKKTVDIEALDKQALAEELESELIEDGFDSLEDEEEYD